MDSIRRGFGFFRQAWEMAWRDPDLLLPSFLALLIGMVVTVIGGIPIGVAFTLFGEHGIGMVVGFGLSLLLVFAQYVVAYIFSAMTVYLVHGYLTQGDGHIGRAWKIVQRDFLDLLSLAAAATAVDFLQRIVRGRGGSRGRQMLAGLIGAAWTEAAHLILPAMVLEDLDLGAGVRRAGQIVRSNLLLIGVSTIGVKFVTGLIGFLLGATGIGLGLGVGLGLVSLSGGIPAGYIFGGGLGILLAGFFILAAVIIGTYTATAYHTCLYIWARQVEISRERGAPLTEIAAPAPLAAVLNS